MSNKATTWAYGLRIGKSSAKFVLAVLADKADESHSCFPSVRMIAEETELSPRSVKDQLAFLEAVGLVSRTRRYKGFGGRSSDRYVLPVGMTQDALDARRDDPADPAVDAVAPLDSGRQAQGAGSAPNEGPEPVDNPVTPLGAEFAPDEFGPVDNWASGATSGAGDASLGANGRRALRGLTPSINPQKDSSSSVNETGYGVNERADDDEEIRSLPPDSQVGHAAGWSQPLAVTLRKLHPGLDLDLLLRKLAAAGIDAETVDLAQAADEIIAAAARQLGDAAAYVAVAIGREPWRWPLVNTSHRSIGVPPSPPTDAEIESDVRSARARGLVDADWPSRMPLTPELASRLAAARNSERDQALRLSSSEEPSRWEDDSAGVESA